MTKGEVMTRGELTTGMLIKFLKAFPEDTKVVLGQSNNTDVITECHANTYYPRHLDCTVWVVLDEGDNN